MNNRRVFFLCTLFSTLLAAACVGQKASADEVWSTDEYDVIYLEDRNRTAVWRYGEDGTIFIEGLAGVYSDRGTYTGYWAQPSSSLRCDTFREGADGEPSYHWGRFELTFIDSAFPARWYADFGLCDLEPSIHLDAVPVISQPISTDDEPQ